MGPVAAVPDLFCLCVWLYAVLAYKPGGQPIGALERGFGAIGKAFGKLFARRVRDPEPAGATA